MKKASKKPSDIQTGPLTFLDNKNHSTGDIAPKNDDSQDISDPGCGVAAFDPGSLGAFAIFYLGNISIYPNALYGPHSMRVKIACCQYHVVEKVSAMKGQGVTSMFTFGREYQKCLSACEVNADGNQYYVGHVSPQVWQDYFTTKYFITLPKGKDNQYERKKMLLEIAIKAGLEEARNPMDMKLKDAADAFLILKWTLETAFQYR